MNAHRRYYFEYPKPWEKEGSHETIKDILRGHCEKFWWYNEPVVEGEPFGRLSFSFTVSANDQWWCHTRAMKLASKCCHAVGLTTKQIPEPVWQPLPPHTNRGSYRT